MQSIDVLLGCENNPKADILCLELKRYIYNSKTKNVNPTLNGFIKILSLALKINENTKCCDNQRENWAIVRRMVQDH